MAVPAGWNSLGCSVYRCCCCPNTVYYPPTMSVHIHQIVFIKDEEFGYITGAYNSDVTFDISCMWKGCPRNAPESLVDDGTGNVVPKCCESTVFNEETGLDDCVGEQSQVLRCHPCHYQLIGADGTPLIKLDPDTGLVPAGTPTLLINNPAWHPGDGLEFQTITIYLKGFDFYCQCWTEESSEYPPAIPCYIEPDTGAICGWRAANSYQDQFGNPYSGEIYNELHTIDEFPNPPFQMFNPMDPFKFSCCDPFRVRFLQCLFEPTWYTDHWQGSIWPDTSEWPLFAGEYIPWNFPLSSICCNAPDCTATYDVQSGPLAGTYRCQENYLPGGTFGYCEITSDASCFLPREYTTNCLDAYKEDGC